MESPPRSGSGKIRERTLREPRHQRHRGAGRQRSLGERSRLWPGLGANGRSRLGSLSSWPLGMGRLLWLDLDQWRPLGLGSLSLRPVVQRTLRLGVVAGRDLWSLLLEAGASWFLRMGRTWIWRRFWIRIRQCRLGCAGSV